MCGADGTAGADGVAVLAQITAATYSGFVSPAELAMLLSQAKVEYLFADPTAYPGGYANAAALFTWIEQVTAPFDVQPPPAPSNYTAAEVLHLATIHQQCQVYIARLVTKVDFHGHRDSYAPMASYKTYSGFLDQLLGTTTGGGILGVVETAYSDYFAADQTQQVQTAQLGVNASQALGTIGYLTTQMATLESDLNKLIAQIAAAEQAVDAQKILVREAVRRFETGIASAFNCSTFDNVLSGLSMLAFIPSGAGRAAQIFAIIGGSIGTDLINGMSTAPISGMKKQYIIHQVQALGTQIASVNEGYTVSGKFITSDDPNGYKIIGDANQLSQLLRTYSSVSGAEAALEAVQKLVTLVQNLNALIVQYNNDISEYLNMQAQVAQFRAQITQVQAALSANDPTLPECAAFMGTLYEAIKNLTLDTLYLSVKSYRLWALQELSVADLLGARNPSDITHATLTASAGQLGATYTAAVENMGKNLQPFPTSGTGIEWIVSDEATIGQLQANNKVSIVIPAPAAQTPISQNPFAGLVDVRITRARAWIDGVTTRDDTVLVSVTHTGAETIVNQQQTAFAFEHARNVTAFRYHPGTGAIQMDAIVTVDPAGQYGLIGPFTTWQVEVNPIHNTGLDLSGVTQVRMEFFGYAYGTADEPVAARGQPEKPVIHA